MRRLLVLGVMLVAGASAAQKLTPELVAKIEREKTEALQEIDKKYGGKKPSQLSSDERRSIIAEQAAATAGVLDKNGVSAKDFDRYQAKQSMPERAATKREAERLEIEAKKKAQQGQVKAADADEVQVQRGVSDANPVVVEESPDGETPTIERGLPPDAQTDQAAANDSDRAADTATTPARKTR